MLDSDQVCFFWMFWAVGFTFFLRVFSSGCILAELFCSPTATVETKVYRDPLQAKNAIFLVITVTAKGENPLVSFINTIPFIPFHHFPLDFSTP